MATASIAVVPGAGVSGVGEVWERDKPSALLWTRPALCLMEKSYEANLAAHLANLALVFFAELRYYNAEWSVTNKNLVPPMYPWNFSTAYRIASNSPSVGPNLASASLHVREA